MERRMNGTPMKNDDYGKNKSTSSSTSDESTTSDTVNTAGSKKSFRGHDRLWQRVLFSLDYQVPISSFFAPGRLKEKFTELWVDNCKYYEDQLNTEPENSRYDCEAFGPSTSTHGYPYDFEVSLLVERDLEESSLEELQDEELPELEVTSGPSSEAGTSKQYAMKRGHGDESSNSSQPEQTEKSSTETNLTDLEDVFQNITTGKGKGKGKKSRPAK